MWIHQRTVISVFYQQLSAKVIKKWNQSGKRKKYKTTLTHLQNRINDNEKCLNTITQEKGVSNWYQVSYPISDQGFNPRRQKFWDSLRKTYIWELRNIPFSYTCGSKIHIQYAMSYKKRRIYVDKTQIVNRLDGKFVKCLW